jgi:hypothetical protein
MIFGIQNPKFEEINGAETVDLLHSNMEPDYIQPNEVEFESIVNGNRSFLKKYNPHAEFSVTIHLFKYANPGSIFWKIYGYLGKDVWFYPHKDNSLKLKCHIVDVKLFYLEQPFHYDACTVVFRTVEPVQYLEETFTSILVNKSGVPIKDKDGNTIYIKKGPEIFREQPGGGGGINDEV